MIDGEIEYMDAQSPLPDLSDALVDAFARELFHQHQMAKLSIDLLNNSFQEHTQGTDIHWYHLESLVKSLMAMTNILWCQSTRNPHKHRSRELRRVFKLDDFQIPKDLRETRHGLEHFDERLDIWWQNDPAHNLADRNIGHPSSFGGFSQQSIARNFDPVTGVLSVFDKSVDLGNVMNFMDRILVSVALSGYPRR